MAMTGQPARVMDNICGALSRMVMANSGAVPLEKVQLPVNALMQCVYLVFLFRLRKEIIQHLH